MSEYFRVTPEPTGDPNTMELITNHTLTVDGEEVYLTPDEGEFGSPLAQTIFFGVDGVQGLRITGESLYVTRQPDVSWELLIDDLRDALRDFFL